MLTPEQVAGLQIAFDRLTDPVQDFLIQDIARRVKKAGEFTSTAAYQTYRAQMIGKELPEIEKELSRLVGIAEDEAAQLIEQAAEFGYINDVERLGGAVPFAENAAMQQITAAAVALARTDLSNLTQTIGFINQDGVSRTLTAAYEQATDFAFMQTVTGATDYNTATRKACAKLAASGIQSISYESGIHTSLEAAVRRNLMGGTGLMVEQISQKNHDELGADGWEISAHAASAPDHEPIQGKQYSDKEYRRLNNSLVRRIGTLNCGHNASPVKLGVSLPQYTKAELRKFREDNAKGVDYDGRHFDTVYQATQHQRQIERSIRAWKRRAMTGTYDGAEIRLRLLRAEYRRFSKAAGLRTENERMFVAGFGRKKGHP